MKVLVTGATGFIGSHLVEKLLAEGYEVRGMTTSPTRAQKLKEKGVEPFLGDLRNYDAVREATRGVSLVFHLGAILSDWGPWELFYQVNVLGTANVLRAALEEKVERVVYTSSIAATGLEDYPGLKDEGFPLTSSSHPYCRSKAEAERIARDFMARGLPVVILRPVYVYGPGERNVGVYTVARLLKVGFRLLPGDGQNYHHRIYVKDLVEGIMLAATRKEALGQTYILGGPLRRAKEFWGTLARLMGTSIIWVPIQVGWAFAFPFEIAYRLFPLQGPPLISFFRIRILTNNNAWDCSKVQRELGFIPRTDIEEGLRETLRWWREHGWL
ncbi:MAG: NAD-dependent epimerase/dehydratase family protein [Anaerolineae bacterium]|nr:NAD-dependent epimerase/dehydratase family protein [Anaerolineae bacterium]MDW8101866.1 NAD-dependent epimerase/dehydratase family protein [Anaerolineae bacterium]